MTDLNQAFAPASGLEQGILANVDELVELGLDRGKIEPIVRLAISHLAEFTTSLRDYPEAHGLFLHDASFCRALIVGGLAHWMQDKEIVCSLAIQAYINRYANREA